MTQFGITKIVDGIFISDLSLLHDSEFIFGNKVSHLIMWIPFNQNIDFANSSVKTLILKKTQKQGLLPKECELLKSKQQCLCTLLCSDFQSEAAMLLSTYFIKKHAWSLNSIFRYLGMRLQIFNPRVEVVQQLQDFQINIQMNEPNIKLKNIEFTFEFLESYRTDDNEQKLLLNTAKNTFLGRLNCFHQSKNYPKRRKRVQWLDRMKHSTALAQFNYSKFAVFNRRASLKSKNKLCEKQNNKPNTKNLEQNQKNRNPQKQKKNCEFGNFGEFIMDDLEFESLRQLQRLKPPQNRFKGSLRKINSIRFIKGSTEKNRKPNKQDEIHQISRCNSIGPLFLNKINENNIFRNLKSISKLKLSQNA